MQTVIGKIDGKYKGIYQTFPIYYGNVASTVVDNKILHLKQEDYEEMLKNFLNSEEGMEYRIPTDYEVKKAIRDVINEETKANIQREEVSKAELEKKLQKEKEAAEKSEEEERELRRKEVAAQSKANELKEIELQDYVDHIKLQKTFLIILAVFNFLFIAAIVTLVVLYNRGII